MRDSKRLIAALTLATIASTTNADLLNRGVDSLGNRLIYDGDSNITWYDFTKSIASWVDQVSWADALDVNFGGIHYIDWRLPRSVDGNRFNFGFNGSTDAGYNIVARGGEMAHLFYTELGNLAYYDTSGNPQPGWGLNNTGPFQHLGPYYYWSGTTESQFAGNSWYFHMGVGEKNVSTWYPLPVPYQYALAVRDGDVTIAIPEPRIYVMLLAGVALLGFVARRGKQSRA